MPIMGLMGLNLFGGMLQLAIFGTPSVRWKII